MGYVQAVSRRLTLDRLIWLSDEYCEESERPRYCRQVEKDDPAEDVDATAEDGAEAGAAPRRDRGVVGAAAGFGALDAERPAISSVTGTTHQRTWAMTGGIDPANQTAYRGISREFPTAHHQQSGARLPQPITLNHWSLFTTVTTRRAARTGHG